MTWQKKEIIERIEDEIQELKMFLGDVEAKTEKERHLKENEFRVFRITPMEWNEKYRELEISQAQAHHWISQCESLESQSSEW